MYQGLPLQLPPILPFQIPTPLSRSRFTMVSCYVTIPTLCIDANIDLDIQLGTEGPVIVRHTTRTQTGPDAFFLSSKLFLLTFNRPTLVHGTEVLDERFVRGWNKLPHELKVSSLPSASTRPY